LQINELSGEERRQLIDVQQVHQALREAQQDKARRFDGSMRWAERNGAEYLLRKIGQRETSLGPRDEVTEAQYAAFINGREANKEKLRGLSDRLDAMAPINRAMGLGRVPLMAARIARKCDEKGLLGRSLCIVGTNALYAYEVMAGVRISSDIIATTDMDLLHDTRRKLGLALDKSVRDHGLIGLLRDIDKSFGLTQPKSFRASNKDGYLVDLIQPQGKNVLLSKASGLADDPLEDLEGVEIIGLDWLVNAPKRNAVALDQKGYPVLMAVIDPRVFALHKAWVAERGDRDPLKRRRDKDQALAAALIAKRYMGLDFYGPDITALPDQLRQRADSLLAEQEKLAVRQPPTW
jgi:hypothetical protein